MVENLKELRRMLNLTQIELAKKVGVSMMTLQLWERGAMSPSPENKEKLYRVLKELKDGKRNKGIPDMINASPPFPKRKER